MILSDELNHASIVDAVRLSRPARKVIYGHSSMDELREALASCPRGARKLVVTDGVFSMEGDLARLPEIVELARAHDAAVVVDDSHGDGRDGRDRPRRRRALRPSRRDRRDHEHARQGARRRGRRLRRGERRGLRGARAALAAAAVLERAPADGRLQRARGGPRPAPGAGAGRAAARALRALPRRGCARSASGPSTARRRSSRSSSARRSSRSASASACCEEGVFVTGFGFPVVPEGTARVRVQMSAALEPAHIESALEVFERVGLELESSEKGRKEVRDGTGTASTRR